jgi:hypothetical protein
MHNFPLRGSHPLRPGFPTGSCSLYKSTLQSYNPAPALTGAVWAFPRSLATTCGITIVFSSSGYLDVSVLRVSLPINRDNTSSMYWVVPFGNPRINLYVPIPVAYRSLSRPSSPLRAKASAIRPYLLSRISYVYLNSTLSQHVNELVPPLDPLGPPTLYPLTLARVIDKVRKGQPCDYELFPNPITIIFLLLSNFLQKN